MLHGWEWLVILLVVLLLFGAKRIPELGKGLGKGIRSFKEGLSPSKSSDDKVDAADDESEQKLISEGTEG